MAGNVKLMTSAGGGVILTPAANTATDVILTIPITSGSVDAFPSGTLMLFQQTTAPTGWTKQTTHDNKALRVVSGTASSGGSVAFTTAFASGLNAGATTLDSTMIPSHRHAISCYDGSASTQAVQITQAGQFGYTKYTDYTGGGGSHTHSLPSFAVQYVDLIIASKN